MGGGSDSYKKMGVGVREEISQVLAMGMSQAQIARQVGFSPCWLTLEIKQHHVEGGGYRAFSRTHGSMMHSNAGAAPAS